MVKSQNYTCVLSKNIILLYFILVYTFTSVGEVTYIQRK